MATAVLVSLRRLPGARLRAAAFRHVSRPLLERMSARLEVPILGGCRMIVDTSDVIGRSLAISGTWEPHVTRVFRTLLSPGDVCVDVGASVGYYTLLASKLVGRDGHVYSLEPAPRTYDALASNLRLNRSMNVTALPLAAGAEEGWTLLYDGPPGNPGQASLRGLPDRPSSGETASPSGAPVSVRPLASLIPEADIARTRLVKIDVEGYEAEVIRGLDAFFERARPAVLVELHLKLLTEQDLAVVSTFCSRHGLQPFKLVDRHFQSGSSGPVPLPLDAASLPDRQDLLLAPANFASLPAFR